MASQQSTVDFLVDQMSAAGDITSKKMFGEYGIYCDGKFVAVVSDDQLFIKPTAGGRAYLSAAEITETPPYPGAKPWLQIGGERWDEAAWLAELVQRSARELSLPAPKKKK